MALLLATFYNFPCISVVQGILADQQSLWLIDSYIFLKTSLQNFNSLELADLSEHPSKNEKL